MPTPPKAKTGPDYIVIKNFLSSSGVQQSNNALYQSLFNLVEGSRTFQGFIDNEFPQVDGSLSSLYNAVTGIIEELQDRNNSKYSISLTTSEVLSLPNNVESLVPFDHTIFDDGQMHVEANDPDWNLSRVRINTHAQWHIHGRVVFCTPATAQLKIVIRCNGVPIIMSEVGGQGKFILPFTGLVELLKNDIITMSLLQTSNTDISVIPYFHMNRVSYVDKRTGRTEPALDDSACNDEGVSGDCLCALRGVQFAVLPQSKVTYFLDQNAKIIGQTPSPTDKASTFCANRKGNFYIAIDDVATGFTKLEERAVDGSLIKSYDLPIKIGQGPTGAYHSLMELPCGMILSVNRATHKLVEYDLTTNTISRILGLTIDPLDGCVNQRGNKLLYTEGTKLQCWNLVGDGLLGTIGDFGYPIYWPTWLTDCTYILSKAGYLSNGELILADLTGAILRTYSYDNSLIPNGLLGIAANKSLDLIWVVGLDSKNRPTTVILKMSDGLFLKQQGFGFAPAVVNETAMVGAVYQPIKCDIT